MSFFRRQSNADHDDNGTPCDITTVGRLLKTERENQKATLDSVSSITRIGKSYLEAIEDGDLSRLPGLAYIRGFVRLYAAHLGLSQDEVLRALDRTTPNQAIAADTTPAGNQSKNQTQADRRRRNRPVIALLVVAVITAVALPVYKSGKKEHPAKSYETANSPQTKGQTAVPSSDSKPVESSTHTSESKSSEPAVNISPQQGLVLRLKAVSDSRMHITIDGTISQEYDLVAGDLVEWKAEKNFQLDLDNAAAIEAELSGKQLPPFGDTGKPAHLVITSSGVQKN